MGGFWQEFVANAERIGLVKVLLLVVSNIGSEEERDAEVCKVVGAGGFVIAGEVVTLIEIETMVVVL